MPKNVGKSGLLAKLGAKVSQAVAEHKDDETTYSGGGGGLPAGIDGGVAKLVDCKFDTVKPGKKFAGEPFFYAAAVVVQPVDFEGMRVQGGRTSVMEMVCDTPDKSRKTVGEHIAWVLNELRKLGINTGELAEDGSDLEAIAAALKAAGPYLKFRTWIYAKQIIDKRGGKFVVCDVDKQGNKTDKGTYATEAAAKVAAPFAGKDPMVNHQWEGVINGYVPSDDEPAVDDATAAAADEDVPVEPATDAGDDDLDALAELADDSQDEAAAIRLQELAKDAGMSDEEIAAIDDYKGLAAAIRGDAEPAADDSEAWQPAKGEMYRYKPPVKGPGGKAMAGKKEVDCEVASVVEAKQTVSLKNLADKKTIYKDVAWGKLIPIE